MKRIIYFLLICCFPLFSHAQWKTVEKSSKKQPTWVGGAERNYLIVSAEASTIEDAKEKILISLKQQIVGAVATQIESTTTIERNEIMTGNKSNYIENTNSSIRSKLAKIPFVSEVSLSKAKDFYWEKLYNKKDRLYKYEYHIRYLFTDFEISSLVNEFNKREEFLNKQLDQYKQRLDQIDCVEDIDLTLSELQAFLTEFDEEDSRYAQIEQLCNNYRKLYQYITIQQKTRTTPNKVTIGLYLDHKPISCKQIPQLLSNCVSMLNVVPEDKGIFHISFNRESCYEEDDNFIDIRFRFGNKIISKRIYIEQE